MLSKHFGLFSWVRFLQKHKWYVCNTFRCITYIPFMFLAKSQSKAKCLETRADGLSFEMQSVERNFAQGIHLYLSQILIILIFLIKFLLFYFGVTPCDAQGSLLGGFWLTYGVAGIKLGSYACKAYALAFQL